MEANSKTVVTAPEEAREPIGLSPFQLDEPSAFGALVLFRDREDRARFLNGLKRRAGKAPVPPDDVETVSDRLEMEYDLAIRRNDGLEALGSAVEWWSRVRRETYHAYQLAVEVGPFRKSCLIAFGPRERPEIASEIAYGAGKVEEEKRRVMDFFGFAGEM